MNSTEFKQKFSSYFDILELGNLQKLNSLRSLSHLSDSESIFFYNIPDRDDAIEKFKLRMRNLSFGLIIINKATPDLLKFLKGKNYAVSQSNFAQLQTLLAKEFYPRTNSSLKIVGITGTNGKSSVAHLCTGLAKLCQKKAIFVGTLGVYDQDGKSYFQDIRMTSPPYLEMRNIISLAQTSVDVIFVEVSSHCLEQNRFKDIGFDLCAWTNLSQDHLDYHINMESYFQSKKLILDKVNMDTPLYFPNSQRELLNKVADARATLALPLRSFKLKNISKVFNVEYNRDNLELALSLVNNLFSQKEFDLSDISLPKGRLSLIEKNNKTVIVDYAHTPDALIRLCQGCRQMFPDKNIILLFGCGGNRDRKKRKLMGEAATNGADFLYITSDNPRDEDPLEIIDDILSGVRKKFKSEKNRKICIELAIKNLGESDVLLIAGKGHETYQEIKGKRYQFDDFVVAQNALVNT